MDSMTYERKASPQNWVTTSYDVRRLGCSAWETGLLTRRDAEHSREIANRIAPGHVVIANQSYVGDLAELIGATRTVLV